MSYKIITDTCCDFPAAMYDELGLVVCKLAVLYKEQEIREYTEEWLKEFFDGMRQGTAYATTAAVNMDEWKAAIEPVLQEGNDALVLSFSSGLSCTYQNATLAAEELQETYPDRKINVVDTLCASLGQGLLVYYACQKRDEGLTLEELTAWVEETKLKVCHWVIADDLMHLKRGGRISAATAIAGTLLQIKPVIHVDNEGHLVNVAKARGRKSAIQLICDKVGQTGIPGENDTIFICHGDCEEDAKQLAEKLKEKYGTKKVFYYYIGAVIGAHTGPGVMAVFYLGTER
ncbi:MAG: DegV family protein [Oscillospiraceae bacterium]|nr:DegV family protein [Oscillospiraceae bacterium]